MNLLKKLTKQYVQGRYEYLFLTHSIYPGFVLERRAKELDGEIPVFVFHAVTSDDLEEKLRYLLRNGYRTINGDELWDYLSKKKAPSPRTVVLTFDDGHLSLWSVAYPLLKKYGLTGIAFIVPTWVREAAKEQPGKGNGQNGIAVVNEDVYKRSTVDRRFVSWEQVITMHQSGVIDFQSHSLTHEMVFTSDKIKDFLNPSCIPSYNERIPIPNRGKEDVINHPYQIGMPIYTIAPRLTGARRYFDDEGLREACISYVRERGGPKFFDNFKWRKDLAGFVDQYKSTKNGLNDHYEGDEEREEAILWELAESKAMIERRLDKPVRHLCFPYFSGSDAAISLASRCGYLSTYWGWTAPFTKFATRYGHDHLHSGADLTDLSTGDLLKGRRTNRPGDDPFKIVRLPGDYIFRLPGKGRQSLARIIARKCFRNLRSLGKR